MKYAGGYFTHFPTNNNKYQYGYQQALKYTDFHIWATTDSSVEDKNNE